MTNTQRIVYPPSGFNWTVVVLQDDEDIEWLWNDGPNGSYVTGYVIRKKPGLGKSAEVIKKTCNS